MKFTNGFWAMRDGIVPAYAIEYGGHMIRDNELTVYLPAKHIAGRGDPINISMLTVTLSGPLEGIIKVSAVHHAGTVVRGPFVPMKTGNPQIEILETEEELIYCSGNLKAVIDKRPGNYRMSFYEGDRFLTESGYHNLAYMKDGNTGRNYMTEQHLIDVDEYVYGLGERFTPFVKNGQTVEMWNEDGGTASEIAYKNIPFHITNKGYGVLVNHTGDVAYEIGSEKVERIQFAVEGECLEYYLISGGSPMKTVEKYTELTGRPALVPAWSFGLWLSTSFKPHYDEKTTSEYISGMAQRKIPLQVFHFDAYWMDVLEWCNYTWDPKVTTDPRGMLERYHEKGLHVCVWINSYIAQKSCLFAEGKEKGYLLKRTDGSVWQTDLWQPGMAIVDFTNPDACAWFQEKLKALMDMGVDCFKTDFAERIPVRDVVWHDGSDPVKMHNYYSVLYNQTVFSLLQRERGKGDAVVFARSSSIGGQRFPVHWGGDCTASYVSMAETLRGGLSLSLSGYGFWSHDISGFEQTATPDLYKRWCQFGLLSSHSRLHGADSLRVPWEFDEESCEILKEFVNLKCRLMPYLYGMAAESHTLGRPVLRPMFLEFPHDPGCDTLDRQYMLGNALLVAPVFKESGEVDYYLPKGTWINLITGEKKEGGSWQKEVHDYHSLPLMIRENTILPMGKKEDDTVYDYADGVTLVLSEFTDGGRAIAEIPDTSGEIVMRVRAEREGDEITVRVEGNQNYSVKNLGSGIVREQSV